MKTDPELAKRQQKEFLSAIGGLLAMLAFIGFIIYAVLPSKEEHRKWRETVANIDADARAQQQVASQLRDPVSADFSDGKASTQLPGVRCGTVNAKNGFGAKGGQQRYITTDRSTILEETVGPGEMDRDWASMC